MTTDGKEASKKARTTVSGNESEAYILFQKLTLTLGVPKNSTTNFFKK